MIGTFARFATIACVLTTTWRSLNAAPPIAVFEINEQSLRKVRGENSLASAEVNDPVYKRTQRYQGIWLSDVLKDLNWGKHPESDIYIRFRCRDGYLPFMPLSRARTGKALIAIRDANAPQGQDWQLLPESKTPSTPGPGYLVWVSSPGNVEEFPWPYQMVSIELVTSADVLADLGPNSSKPGHDLFVSHCLKCHAINGVGGTFGPELNSPCSVTEYWNPRILSRFIAKASSVRTGTRMPDFDSLPEKDIGAIVNYLQSMAGHKTAGAACP